MIFGGEALEASSLAPWFERCDAKATQLVNMYGITETTVHVTYRPLSPADVRRAGGGSPIGQRIPDLRSYILDARRQPVPIGVAGELYVGGAGVARGYLNRPELTAERFLPDPFASEPGARMYKTGDLGRWLADGTIEFLGRNDFQVKIRGFRIELGEIEARLAEAPGMREAVVLAREDSPGRQAPGGLCRGRGRGHAPGAGHAARALGASLPEYMLPGAFVALEKLPLTPNGKLDRQALPAPEDEALVQRSYEAPVGEIEVTLAHLWSDLLHVERVGRHDHFFELGGHSLLAVQLVERLRRHQLQIELLTVFDAPSLQAMASRIKQEQVQALPYEVVPVRTDGSRRPLFLFHPGGGSVAAYERLPASLMLTCRSTQYEQISKPSTAASLSRIWRRGMHA